MNEVLFSYFSRCSNFEESYRFVSLTDQIDQTIQHAEIRSPIIDRSPQQMSTKGVFARFNSSRADHRSILQGTSHKESQHKIWIGVRDREHRVYNVPAEKIFIDRH